VTKDNSQCAKTLTPFGSISKNSLVNFPNGVLESCWWYIATTPLYLPSRSFLNSSLDLASTDTISAMGEISDSRVSGRYGTGPTRCVSRKFMGHGGKYMDKPRSSTLGFVSDMLGLVVDRLVQRGVYGEEQGIGTGKIIPLVCGFDRLIRYTGPNSLTYTSTLPSKSGGHYRLLISFVNV
jgi:hypothetical protein